MESSSASTISNRVTIDGEVLPQVALDPALVAVKDTWDLDSAFNASAQESGVFKITFPADIDPKGEYTVPTDFRPAQSPPTATPTPPVDVPEPVALLIVQGDMKIYHERSPEEPPAHFLEGEDVDEAESDEDQAGGSTPAPPMKPARMVTAGIPEPVALLIVQGDMKIYHERSPEEPPAHFLEGEDVESDEDQAGGSTPAPPGKRARMVTAGNVATLGLADEGFTFASVLESHVPAGPAKK